MFEELMHSIWDEFSKLVFRAEIEVQPGAGAPPRPATASGSRRTLAYSGGTAENQPSALQEVVATSGAHRVRRRRRQARDRSGNGGEVVETVVKDEHDKHRPQRPLLVRQSGKKYKKCHGA